MRTREDIIKDLSDEQDNLLNIRIEVQDSLNSIAILVDGIRAHLNSETVRCEEVAAYTKELQEFKTVRQPTPKKKYTLDEGIKNNIYSYNGE